MRANEELQERRKAADVQQKAEEALAFACASKLQQREAMIRKRKEELRAWALERSARLTAQGAAALATAQVNASSGVLRRCFRGAEMRGVNGMAYIRSLIPSLGHLQLLMCFQLIDALFRQKKPVTRKFRLRASKQMRNRQKKQSIFGG